MKKQHDKLVIRILALMAVLTLILFLTEELIKRKLI